MHKKRRLLVIASSFPLYKGDNAGSFVYGMVEALSNKGYQLELLIPSDSKVKEILPLKGDIRIHMVRYSYPKWSETLFYRNGVLINLKENPLKIFLIPPFILNLYRVMGKLIKEVDGIISHWLFPNGYIVALHKHNLPSITIAHGSDVSLLSRSPFKRSILKKIIRHQKIVAVNSNLASKIKEIIKEDVKIEILPMGIDKIELKDPLHVQLRNNNEILIGYIGRLIYDKGVDIAMKAISLLDYKDKITFAIIGTGPEEQKLRKLGEDLRLKTIFLGKVKRDVALNLLKLMDIIIIPSRGSDSSPLTVLEAINSGKVVIGSNNCGIMEVAQNSILYFQTGNPISLKEVLDDVIKEKKTTITQSEARRTILERFFWNNYIVNFENLLFGDKDESKP